MVYKAANNHRVKLPNVSNGWFIVKSIRSNASKFVSGLGNISRTRNLAAERDPVCSRIKLTTRTKQFLCVSVIYQRSSVCPLSVNLRSHSCGRFTLAY